MNIKTTTLAILAIVTAVSLVTASDLASPVFAVKSTGKTTSSITPISTSTTTTKVSGPIEKFTSCIKATHGTLSRADVNTCYDKFYTGSSGTRSTTSGSTPLGTSAATSLIPIVATNSTSTSTSGHTGHHSHVHSSSLTSGHSPSLTSGHSPSLTSG